MSRKRNAVEELDAPAAQRQRHDTLPSALRNHIASFLDLRDIRNALCVSRAFSRLRGQRGDSTTRSIRVCSDTQARTFATAGAWTSFVTALTLNGDAAGDDHDLGLVCLNTLAQQTPCLRSLEIAACHLPRTLRLPSSITRLAFHHAARDEEDGWDTCANTLMSAVDALPGLQHLDVWPELPRAALLHVCSPAQLTTLSLHEIVLDSAFIDALRTATHLRVVELSVVRSVLPDPLFSTPVPWIRLYLHVHSVEANEFPLAQLPVLTDLDTNLLLSRAQPWHAQITTLAIDGHALADVHRFPNATDLAVNGCFAKVLDIESIAQLQHLHKLSLSFMNGTFSLAFLPRLPCLAHLELCRTCLFPYEENLGSIVRVRTLTHLKLDHAFTSPLQTPFIFEPPSLLLPNLRTFVLQE